MANCIKCKAPLEDGTKFCDACGTEQPQTIFCENCGKKLENSATFCDSCGTPVGAASKKEPDNKAQKQAKTEADKITANAITSAKQKKTKAKKQDQSPNNTQKQKQQKTKKVSSGMKFLWIIFFLAAIAMLFWFCTENL